MNDKNTHVDLMLILSEEDRHLYTTEADLIERGNQRKTFLEKATKGLEVWGKPGSLQSRQSASGPGGYQLEEYNSDQEETHTLSDEDFD